MVTRSRLVLVVIVAVACHREPSVRVEIDCPAYVAHLETVVAAHIDGLSGEAGESARRHFAETNPAARVELLAKCKAIGTTTSDKLECVMTARTPDQVSACPDL
jgi:hypothetical protein